MTITRPYKLCLHETCQQSALCLVGVWIASCIPVRVASAGVVRVLCPFQLEQSAPFSSGITAYMVCRRVHLTLVYAHAATACEGTGNKKQCTHQERKGSGHCWKEEVREKAYNQNVQSSSMQPAIAAMLMPVTWPWSYSSNKERLWTRCSRFLCWRVLYLLSCKHPLPTLIRLDS